MIESGAQIIDIGKISTTRVKNNYPDKSEKVKYIVENFKKIQSLLIN